MKKIFLSVLFLIISSVSFSQTFVKKYNSFISKNDGVLGDWENTSLTVVFNEEKTDDIVFYFGSGKVRRFYQIGDVEKDKTKTGEPYQIITCVDGESGKEVAIQLFDQTDTLRVIIQQGYFLEFHK